MALEWLHFAYGQARMPRDSAAAGNSDAAFISANPCGSISFQEGSAAVEGVANPLPPRLLLSSLTALAIEIKPHLIATDQVSPVLRVLNYY